MAHVPRILALSAVAALLMAAYLKTEGWPSTIFSSSLLEGSSALSSRPSSSSVARAAISEIRQVPLMSRHDAHERMLHWGFARPTATEERLSTNNNLHAARAAQLSRQASSLEADIQSMKQKMAAYEREYHHDEESLAAVQRKQAALERISSRHVHSDILATKPKRQFALDREANDPHANDYVQAIWGNLRAQEEVETPYLPPTGVRLRATTTDGVQIPANTNHDERLPARGSGFLGDQQHREVTATGYDRSSGHWRDLARGVRVPQGIMGGMTYLKQVFHDAGMSS